MKKQNGITLIALVITIIIMLILVAVTVSYGIKSGLLTKAKDGGAQEQKEQERETLAAAVATVYDALTGTIEKADLQAELDKSGDVWEVTGEGTYTVKSPKQNIFTVESGKEPEPSKILADVCKIGDYVKYEDGAEWRVAKINTDTKEVKLLTNGLASDANVDSKYAKAKEEFTDTTGLPEDMIHIGEYWFAGICVCDGDEPDYCFVFPEHDDVIGCEYFGMSSASRYCIALKDGILYTSGDGTQSDPYVLIEMQ